MKVGGEGLTLTSLMQATQNTSADKKLLSGDSKEVHTHASWKMHRWGDSAQAQREAKAQNGVNAVKTALDNEFGHLGIDGFADMVLNAVNTRHGRDLGSTMRVGDLQLVQQESTRLSDLRDAINTVSMAASGYAAGTQVTGEMTEALLGAINDPAIPEEFKDSARAALGALLANNTDNAAVLKEALGKWSEDGQSLKALGAEDFRQIFSMTKSDGRPALAQADVHKITMTLIRDEAQRATAGGGGILRGNDHSSRALTAAYSTFDNGALPRLGGEIFDAIKTTGDIQTALDRLDTILNDAATRNMPELTALFAEVEAAIDASNLAVNADQTDPTVLKANQLSGDNFVLNSAILRVVNPEMMSHLPEADATGKKTVMTTMKVLQQATAQAINPDMGDVTQTSVAFKSDSNGLRAFHAAII